MPKLMSSSVESLEDEDPHLEDRILIFFPDGFRVFLDRMGASKRALMPVNGQWPGSLRMIYVNLTLNLRSNINHGSFVGSRPLIVCNNGHLDPLQSSTDLNISNVVLKIFQTERRSSIPPSSKKHHQVVLVSKINLLWWTKHLKPNRWNKKSAWRC